MFDTHLYHVSLGEKENGYRKYFHYLSESLEFAEHGQIYLLVQIDDYFHADILAKEMFDAFKSTYYQDLDQEPLVSLEDSLKELNHLIESKIQNDRIAISAVAAAVDGEKMYVSSVGQAELYLYRDQQLLPVLENIEVPESFGYVSSGFLEDTDTVFFATKPLLDVISFENFSRIFATPSPMVQKLHTFKEVVQPAEDSSMDMLVLECFIDDYDDSVMSEYFQKGKEWFSRFTEASGSIEIPDHHKEKAANMASEIGSGVTK
ncbi:MAG: hypothetical protein U9Q15_04905 [Patescibacteria group bacterium]|nr:hypothetical protein [Patescibacteria group bacterium]